MLTICCKKRHAAPGQGSELIRSTALIRAVEQPCSPLVVSPEFTGGEDGSLRASLSFPILPCVESFYW